MVTALDCSQLSGSWHNTDRGDSGGTLRLIVSERDDGELGVRGLGVGEGGVDSDTFDWGETETVALAQGVDGNSAWAFNCSFDLGFVRTEVAAYGKEGILIAASFNTFADGSGRADYWTREFFNRERDLAPPGGTVPIDGDTSRARDRPGAAPVGPIDLGPLLGDWVIFADETTGLTRIEISEAGGSVRAGTYLGETECRVFSDDVAGTEAWGLRASYDRGDEQVELYGYLNRGLLALEAGTTFADDSSRAPYFTRAFLYRP